MKTEVIRDGHIGEWFAPYIENADCTSLNEEEVQRFNEWYSANVPQGCLLSVDYSEEPSFSEDEITKELGSVYPYAVIRFIQD